VMGNGVPDFVTEHRRQPGIILANWQDALVNADWDTKLNSFRPVTGFVVQEATKTTPTAKPTTRRKRFFICTYFRASFYSH
jgi:hypothetical protein